MAHKSPKTFYKKGKTEIKGNTREARRLMLIDLVMFYITRILLIIISYLVAEKTGVLSAANEFVETLLSKAHHP